MRDGELDNLYRRWAETAWARGQLLEFETLYHGFRRACWSRRECILAAAAELNLPGRP